VHLENKLVPASLLIKFGATVELASGIASLRLLLRRGNRSVAAIDILVSLYSVPLQACNHIFTKLAAGFSNGLP
jgi:hypothetical protein